MEICIFTLIAAVCIAGSIVIVAGILAVVICQSAKAIMSIFDSDSNEDDEIMEELYHD